MPSNLPPPPTTPKEPPIDCLVQIVDTALASAITRAGPHLACHPGCSQCCHGIFAISQQDAAHLREGLAITDLATANRIRTRAAASLALLQPHFPGDPQTGILDEDYESSPLFNDLADSDDEPCPVLNPITNTCDLYQHRPILCRTFGPPMRTPENNLATCELCFIHATTAEIAAAELDPTLPDLQSQSDAAFDRATNTHGETVIAHALLPSPSL